jgi:hypothetical protein
MLRKRPSQSRYNEQSRYEQWIKHPIKHLENNSQELFLQPR